ncbi:hypothetical protein SPRG_03168 [Saprolegnia parasitica CBS 223.65]|uniref:Uncharacterized protein n=1 Tax=Saprolegnia parasitica (strain CBS 223.65) TaxID=695850 RepID=A0A067CN61_SAPPC|nr:hypothetical protein SPRG_03168 [Saprolegnia parasitica CBS 223.65]KDO31953.1 hypothetical protein SPRG_03168 [Saprolegnia parasitica CBS 223.65]|eukprot:XP_012197150.1 hypothetical protein SPRG_03168 [Saprolegnia parasitica CBS 223.65]
MAAPLMEFHPSMSLEHHAAPTPIPTKPSLAVSSGAPADPDHVWHDVNDTIKLGLMAERNAYVAKLVALQAYVVGTIDGPLYIARV